MRRHTTTHVYGEPPNATPLAIAMNRAAKLPPAERDALFAPTRQAFEEFRAGRGNLDHWRRLADANNIAAELCKLRIASDHGDTFAAAEAALVAVAARQEAGGSWTLRAGEIVALDDAIFVHGIQLRECSKGELRQAAASRSATPRPVR